VNGRHLEARGAQVLGQQLAELHVVIDEQDAARRRNAGGVGGAFGLERLHTVQYIGSAGFGTAGQLGNES